VAASTRFAVRREQSMKHKEAGTGLWVAYYNIRKNRESSRGKYREWYMPENFYRANEYCPEILTFKWYNIWKI